MNYIYIYIYITVCRHLGNKDISYADRTLTNIATPKGNLGIVSLVKEEFVQVYFKTTHRLVYVYIFGGRRVPNR